MQTRTIITSVNSGERHYHFTLKITLDSPDQWDTPLTPLWGAPCVCGADAQLLRPPRFMIAVCRSRLKCFKQSGSTSEISTFGGCFLWWVEVVVNLTLKIDSLPSEKKTVVKVRSDQSCALNFLDILRSLYILCSSLATKVTARDVDI